MLTIRYVWIVVSLLLCTLASADVRMSVGIGFPNVSIGINVPVYPEFAIVPGYPVYYAPRIEANLFFYDGLYWIYQDDNWYESSWYNGPWWLVDPEDVPLFVLRIPVRYYRLPPAYFMGWQFDAPPRWGDRWGRDWDQHRRGWDRWNRGSVPAPAPLPGYQRQYSGDRYPRQIEQQHELNQKNYRYQPHDPVVRQQYQEQAIPRTPAQLGRPQLDKQRQPESRNSNQQDNQDLPHSQPGLNQRDQSVPKKPAQLEKQGTSIDRNYKQDSQRSIPGQQDTLASPRAQSAHKSGNDAQQSPQASPQSDHRNVQDSRRQSQPRLDNRERQVPSSNIQVESQQDKRNQNRGQEQKQDRGRNE